MQRATLIVLIVFFPIFGFLWFGGPWFNSQAGFELAGATLFEDARARFPDLNAMSAPPAESARWLKSRGSAKIVLSSLSHRHKAVLTEIGETWSVKLRERTRALTCREQLESWRISGKTMCSWLGEWLQPKTYADGIEILQERLSIHRSGDGQHLTVTFRAADQDIATTIVDAFGKTLEQRHAAAMQDLRRRVVEGIEAEFVKLTRPKAELEAPLTKTESKAQNWDEETDSELLLKLTAALQRARNELGVNDRQQIGRELEALKTVVREQLLSQPADRKLSDTAIKPIEADRTAIPHSSLILLSHPEWSKPSVIRLSETVATGFSISEIMTIAFVLSIMLGAVLSRTWLILHRRSKQQQHDFYASPFANPHWPNMQLKKETEPVKALSRNFQARV